MLYTLNQRHIEFKNKINYWANNNLNKSDVILSKSILESLKSLKVSGFQNPKPFAGHAKDFLFHCLAIEEISKVNPSISLALITNYLFESNLIRYGNKPQIIKYVNPINSGLAISSVAILDKKNEYNLDTINTKAKEFEDYYLINGEKFCHSNVKDSNYILIFAKTHNGLSAFILEKSFNGIEIISNDSNIPECIIKLHDVKVPKENLLGVKDLGKEMIITTLISSHLSISAYYLGISTKIYNEILVNLKSLENQTYNNDFLSEFSNISSDLDACKIYIYSVAEKKSNGLDIIKNSAFAKILSYNLLNKLLNYSFLNKYLNNKKVSDILCFNIENIYSSDIEDINSIIKKYLIKDVVIKDIKQKVEKNEIKRKQIIFNSNNINNDIDDLLAHIRPILNSCQDENIYSDLEHSDKAVALGLGIGDKENIKIVELFAKQICASIACTYPISKELQWLPEDRIVGSLGKSFYGNIYFALGLSGDKEHLSGIKSTKNIIAINKDKHSNIFSNCDYGIVGDINEILPILIDKLKS